MGRHWIHIRDNCHTAADGLRITGPEAMHALRVKRLRVGEPVTLFDGEGRLLEAEVLQAGRRDLLVRVLREETEAPPRPAVHVRAAAPKGERADRMLEALSQLGAASFAALRTERSVVEPGEGKLERWRRLAIESAKQAGRAHLLRIDPALDFAQALDEAQGADAAIVFDAAGSLHQQRAAAESILLFIGPEGGWSDAERALLQARGIRPARLASYTLRVETAALAGLAVVLHEHAAHSEREVHSCD